MDQIVRADKSQFVRAAARRTRGSSSRTDYKFASAVSFMVWLLAFLIVGSLEMTTQMEHPEGGGHYPWELHNVWWGLPAVLFVVMLWPVSNLLLGRHGRLEVPYHLESPLKEMGDLYLKLPQDAKRFALPVLRSAYEMARSLPRHEARERVDVRLGVMRKYAAELEQRRQKSFSDDDLENLRYEVGVLEKSREAHKELEKLRLPPYA